MADIQMVQIYNNLRYELPNNKKILYFSRYKIHSNKPGCPIHHLQKFSIE